VDIHEMRELVMGERFHLTDHAQNELKREGFRLEDVASTILSGTVIDEDSKSEVGTEWLVEGMNWMKETIRTKVTVDNAGDLIVITVYPRRQRRRTG